MEEEVEGGVGEDLVMQYLTILVESAVDTLFIWLITVTAAVLAYLLYLGIIRYGWRLLAVWALSQRGD